jgi:hypothetical protein
MAGRGPHRAGFGAKPAGDRLPVQILPEPAARVAISGCSCSSCRGSCTVHWAQRRAVRSLRPVTFLQHPDDLGRSHVPLREEHEDVVQEVGGLAGERLSGGC